MILLSHAYDSNYEFTMNTTPRPLSRVTIYHDDVLRKEEILYQMSQELLNQLALEHATKNSVTRSRGVLFFSPNGYKGLSPVSSSESMEWAQNLANLPLIQPKFQNIQRP